VIANETKCVANSADIGKHIVWYFLPRTYTQHRSA